MIFDTGKEKSAQQIGDIKNNNVSIDTSNIDFIVTILSTNLYSKPIESFIRETVSNAWDSHVEAGVEDPVILELGVDSEGIQFCRIQDFGVGLSPERFEKVYKNIGSSTKRDDNTQIGGFGIGRFSALAYSDVVTITSNHEGTKYVYMMYKDGNSISIDLLHSLETEERNGLEVKVNLNYGDYSRFANAVRSQLVYFENLYVVDTTDESTKLIEEEYNTFSIKKYTHFWVNTLDRREEINLVLGKVRYPIRLSNLDGVYPKRVEDYPISIRFEIGDLEVTPNREEILYSAKNKSTIEAKLKLALQEIDDLIMAAKSKDFTLVKEYLQALQDKQYLTLLEKDGIKTVKLKVGDSKRHPTLNGVEHDPKNFLNIYKHIMNARVLSTNYILSAGKIKYVNYGVSLNIVKEKFERIYLSDVANLNNMSKRYIRETFTDQSHFIKNDISVKTYIKKFAKYIIADDAADKLSVSRGYNIEKWDFDFKSFKVLTKFVLGNLKNLKTFNDSNVSKKWIADTKIADKAKRGNIKQQGFDWTQKVNLHVLRHRDHGGGVMTDSKPYEFKGLNIKFKGLTVYAEKGNERINTLYAYLKTNSVRPNLVTVAPTKIKLLETIENFITLDEFMSTEQKLIRNIGTVEFLYREIPFLKEIARIGNLSLISENLSTAVKTLYDFVQKYESAHSRFGVGHRSADETAMISEIYDLCEKDNYFNEEIRGVFNTHKKELFNARFLLPFLTGSDYSTVKNIPTNRINTLVDYLLCRKIIRPSVKAVLKLKEQTIFNITPEENESN